MQKKHFHFIGISGIGMSGIAKILLQQGYHISGCDLHLDNKHVQELQALGCSIAPHHESEMCHDPSISTIVYSSVIPQTHPELQRARMHNIPTLLRAEMLAEIMQQQIPIAVSGSHGKTSTSSLLAHILTQAGHNPSFVIGGHVTSMNTNASHGTGDYIVAEADESDRSLLKLPKQLAITTNIDLEHLETYKDLQDVKQTFITFLNSTPNNGHNIICIDDPGVKSITPFLNKPYSTYGTSSNADIQAKNIKLYADHSTFTIFHKKKQLSLGVISLQEPGMHYVLNATGAICAALHTNTAFAAIQEALQTFTGVDRRFTYKGLSKLHKAHIFDDYGHHPNEIKHTLTVARKKAQNKLIVAFQPHRFSRTQHLWDDFVTTFSKNLIDTLIITDIYAASEQPIDGISSVQLVSSIKKMNPHTSVIYCPIDQDLNHLSTLLNKTLQENDLLLFLGAGKIHKLSEKFI